MAAFNPQIQDNQYPLTARSYNAGSSLDALGDLFKGVSQGVGNFVSGRDKEIQTKISLEANAGATAAAGNPEQYLPGTPIKGSGASAGLSSPIPSEIGAASVRAQRLSEAYNSGQLSDLNYWSQAQTIAKGLKSRYPGYSDVIDQTVTSHFSRNPANRLREELNQQIASNKSQGQQEADKLTAWVYSHAQYMARGETPDMFDPSDLKASHRIIATISKNMQNEQQTQQMSAQLKFSSDSMDQKEKLAIPYLNGEMAKLTDNFLMTNFYPAFDQMDKTGVFNKSMTPEDKVKIGVLMSNTEMNLKNLATDYLNKDHFTGNRGPDSAQAPRHFSWAEVVTDKNKRDAIVDVAMSRLAGYKQLVQGDHWDRLKTIADMNKLEQELNLNRVYKAFPGGTPVGDFIRLSTLPGMQDQTKTAILEQFSGGPAGKLKNEQDMAKAWLAVKPFVDKDTDVGENMEKARKQGLIDSDIFTKSLDAQVTGMIDPGTSKELKDQVYNSMYGSGDTKIIGQFGGTASQVQIFQKLTDSRIIADAKASGNIDKVSNWAQQQFVLIGTDAFTTLNTYADAAKSMNVRWDEKTNKFDYDQQNNLLGVNPMRVTKDMGQWQVTQALTFLNKYSEKLSEIAKAQGHDPTQMLQKVYKGTLPKELFDGVFSGPLIHGMLQPPEETTSGKKAASAEVLEPLRNPMFALSDKRHQGELPNIADVNPDLLTRFAAVETAFGSKVPIVSGYRDAAKNASVGGARHSQHISGNAIDIDVKSLSQGQRVKLIQLARQNGINGIGVYPNSLHFDIGNTRAWGPSYHADSIPTWAQAAL